MNVVNKESIKKKQKTMKTQEIVVFEQTSLRYYYCQHCVKRANFNTVEIHKLHYITKRFGNFSLINFDSV